MDPAAVDEDGLNRLRNTVPSNALGAVPRHDADDECAGHRHENHPRPQGMRVGRDQRGTESLEEEQVGEHANEREQGQRDVGTGDADADGKAGDHQQPRHRGEIREILGDVVRSRRGYQNVWCPI
jgi:hypothetical protein